MPITVPYVELHEGFDEAIDRNGITATIRYLIDWNDRWQFARDVAGTARSFGTGNSSVIRTIPLQYPHNKWLYANSLKFDPAGPSGCAGGESYYEKVIATVTFSTPDFDYENAQGQYSQTYRTLDIDMSAQFMTLPISPFRMATAYGGNPVDPKINPGMLVPQAQISVTAHQVPEVPLDKIFPLIGQLNNATFYGCDVGTVLFLGAKCNRTPTSEGFMAWEVSYQFAFRSVDWNKFWSPAPGIGWDFLVDKSSGAKIYGYGDFTTLP